MRLGAWLLLAVCAVLPAVGVAGPVVPVFALPAAPVIDGSGDEWRATEASVIPLRKTRAENKTDIGAVFVKGGVFGDRVFFYLSWKDSTENSEHKPFVWDDEKGRYIQSKVLEDRLAMQFAMSGDYTTNWLSGNSFTADMWHWKAFRSNSVGLVHDKQTIISSKKLLRSYQGESETGAPIYILRPSDEGDKLYSSKRYPRLLEKKMPKYVVAENPQGSVADIQARGVWQQGWWHLELARKLDTQHPDDITFRVGESVQGGIALFDGTGDDDHVISDTLTFQF